jgi:hypothetical protein
MGRTCGRYGGKNDVNKGFLWQKLKIWKIRCRWEDNITNFLQK